jgi:hypothetical protein
MKYIIQWDNASKRFPYRVLTMSGQSCGYFRTLGDAADYCESR